MGFWLYVLRSQGSGKHYIGSTGDLARRLAEHNGGRHRWSNKYRPWSMIHTEEFENRSEAVGRERYLKSKAGMRERLDLLRRLDDQVSD
ncbi:MAG: GIY-YIG nuclease family protein [Acidobacteria bacterium]|nr:GIY-YIG nuclease family protein [Acidobacteriota bacterium]